MAISPYNVWTLLSIINEGAKENTAAQLEHVLGIPSDENKKMFLLQFQNMSQIFSVSLDLSKGCKWGFATNFAQV